MRLYSEPFPSESEPVINVPTKNVLGGPLQACCFSPITGFYRDGFCNTGPDDMGRHTVCVRVDAPFLEFSKSKGNDLSTPYPMYNFPGLQPGDSWCLCGKTHHVLSSLLLSTTPLTPLSGTIPT